MFVLNASIGGKHETEEYFIRNIHTVEIVYRHIDTAQAYENERGIGKGVRDCGISRQELFITTKLAAELKTYEEAAQAITGSLEKMGLDYIDLMLIHSP